MLSDFRGKVDKPAWYILVESNRHFSGYTHIVDVASDWAYITHQHKFYERRPRHADFIYTIVPFDQAERLLW